MILILGCGKTGVSVAQFLKKNNQKYIVADTREHPPLATDLPECQTFFGKLDNAILDGIIQVIISPGISPTLGIVQYAIQKNIEIISDIDVFYMQLRRTNKKPILIGITGTNGKSTTVALLNFVLRALGKKSIACGNIGVPILEVGFDFDYYVIELSSYQLDYTYLLRLDYGLILNISPDHLDRYQTFENYRNSKLQIHDISEHMIVNKANNFKNMAVDFTIQVPEKGEFGIVNGNIVRDNKVLLKSEEVKLLGMHNLENILAVLSVCSQLELDLQQVSSAICDFKGLPHRLEFVARLEQSDYYNDSKATNAASAIVAIEALCGKYLDVILLLGGAKKDEDYSNLFDVINKNISKVVLLGESSDEFFDYIKVEKLRTNNMREAVDIAKKYNAQCVLLAPACASFDAYDNFEARGDDFKKWVHL